MNKINKQNIAIQYIIYKGVLIINSNITYVSIT